VTRSHNIYTSSDILKSLITVSLKESTFYYEFMMSPETVERS